MGTAYQGREPAEMPAPPRTPGADSNPLDVMPGSDLPAFLDDIDGDMEEQAAIAARMADPETPTPAAPPQASSSALTCPGCGGRELCVCSTMPVFVYLSDGKLVRVVVPSDNEHRGGVGRCLSCERFWIIEDEVRWL
jgi:hypothetical protein